MDAGLPTPSALGFLVVGLPRVEATLGCTSPTPSAFWARALVLSGEVGVWTRTTAVRRSWAETEAIQWKLRLASERVSVIILSSSESCIWKAENMMSQDNRLMPMPAVDRSLDRPLSDIGQVRSYGPAASEPSQLRDYLFVVLKRKWLILSLCLVVTSLVAMQMFRQPSIYEAAATIRIEQRQKNILQSPPLVVNAQPDANFWGTQVKLLESPALARQVALTLDLRHNPNFFGAHAQGGIFTAIKRMVSGDKRTATPAPTPKGLSVVDE